MDDVEEKLRKLASLDTRRAEMLWRFYLSADAAERAEVDAMLDIVLFAETTKSYRDQILLDPPCTADCAGEYDLGSVFYPTKTYARFGLRERDWLEHVLIAGMSGAGKTNLVLQILNELRRHRKPFLVFDWKRNYRDLLERPDFAHLTVFTVGRSIQPFHFNPLLPPTGVSPGEWLMKLVDVIKHAYFVGDGVEYALRRAIDLVYETCKFHDGQPVETPTFQAVRNFVLQQRLQGRMALWRASALRVLESLCFRHGLGPVVNTPANDFDKLLANDIIIELDTLADADKVFLTEAIILWLYEFRKNNAAREQFQHATIIELKVSEAEYSRLEEFAEELGYNKVEVYITTLVARASRQ